MKKPYEKPAIIHSEKTESRAVMCSKEADPCGSTGPMLS